MAWDDSSKVHSQLSWALFQYKDHFRRYGVDGREICIDLSYAHVHCECIVTIALIVEISER